MKISRLPDRLDRMPMLKILVFFAAGIALADRYELPLWFLAGAFVVTGVLALSLRSSAATAAMILTAGFAAAQFRAPRATVPRGVHTVYEVTVEGFPADRGRYAVADASVAAWRDPADGRWHASDARIRLYADSLAGLHAGERIRCRGAVRPFRGGAESYRRLMARRGYAGTLWIAERTLLERLPGRHAGLHRRAVERLSRLPMSAGAAAVVEAMAAGERRGVTPELRTAYSRSGLSHLLAVSGLHTGIVFALVNLALWWLPLFRRGHLLKNLLAAVAVWLFVAAAGFPPSAVRAAAMCTVLQAALASASEYVGLNALAAAGFGMLVWNPSWLGDISFQLSFVAVAAILAWRAALPPLPDPVEGRERRRRRLSDRVRGDCRHCAARFAHVRRRAAGRTGGQSAGHRVGRGRGVRRRIVDARTRRIPRPGVRVRHGERRRRDQRAGPADRLAARRCGRLHPRRMADGGGLRRFCACDPCGVERRTEKKRIFADVITPEEYSLLLTDEVRRAVAAARGRDPLEVALDRTVPHARLVATQVKYLARAAQKLPSYAAAQCILPPLAFEQASSEACAAHKLLEGDTVLDLTCGLGADALFLSRRFRRVVTLERNEMLARVAAENFSRMGVANVDVVNASAEEYLRRDGLRFDWIYADPDRRSDKGRKLVRLEDCSPDIVALKPRLKQVSGRLCVKNSPLFDVGEALRLFPDSRVEVLSLGDECKEVVVYDDGSGPLVTATALGRGSFSAAPGETAPPPGRFDPERYGYLVIPDVSLQKARLARIHLAGKADIWSDNGYGFAVEEPEGVLGRTFAVESIEPYDPKRLKRELKGREAEVLKRDFPLAAEELMRRLGLHAGAGLRLAFTKIGNDFWVIRLK